MERLNNKRFYEIFNDQINSGESEFLFVVDESYIDDNGKYEKAISFDKFKYPDEINDIINNYLLIDDTQRFPILFKKTESIINIENGYSFKQQLKYDLSNKMNKEIEFEDIDDKTYVYIDGNKTVTSFQLNDTNEGSKNSAELYHDFLTCIEHSLKLGANQQWET